MALEPNLHARLTDEYEPDQVDQLLIGRFAFTTEPPVSDTFFWFVDGRKRMHRELAAWARGNFDGVLQGAIPYLSHVEQMGIYRQPVPEFAPASAASAAYQELWEEIYEVLVDEPK
jgi:hypothetical protein